MNERNIIFTPENIISTFGLVIDDRFQYDIEQSNGSFLISSKFSITKKNQSKKSDDCFSTDNYEDVLNPCIVALVNTNFNKDGSFTTAIDFNNQAISNLLKVSNRYLEVYKLMYDIKEFNKYDKVDLVFIADYEFTNKLTMSHVYCQKIKFLEYVDDYQGPIETDVHYFVNDFLKSLDIACINEHTDMDKLYPLIEMQRTINHMVRI
jgi:hypothetical protein